MQLLECLFVLLAGAAEAEDAAADDRSVASRWVQLVQGADPEPCARCALPAAIDHVGGCVAPVDIEAFFAERDEQPARAAAGVENRAAEVFPVQVEFRRIDVDGRPVVSDEAVMPGAWRVQGRSFSAEADPFILCGPSGGGRLAR